VDALALRPEQHQQLGAAINFDLVLSP